MASIEHGNYFADPSEFSVSFKEGVMRNRYGRRFVALSEEFLTGFLESFEIECGEAADEVMRTCGWEYGHTFGRHLDEDLSRYYERSSRRFPMAMFTALLQEAFSRHGWGKLEMNYALHEHGVFVAEVKNAIYSEITGTPGLCSDSLLAGFLAGIYSYYSEERLDCIQTMAPRAKGGVSTFVIALRGRLEGCAFQVAEGMSHDELVASLCEQAING